LVRSVTIEPKHEEVEPVEVKPKVKRTINKVLSGSATNARRSLVKVTKESEVEKPVVLKKSKAVLKTEKYEALVKNAL